jgi:hypothetical protein
MANLNAHFIEFEKRISLSKSRQNELTRSRQAVEKKITEYFRTKSQLGIPRFFIQGSYKMGTMVLKKDKTYDVDLGVRFKNKPGLQPKTLQQNVLRAVKGHTSGGAEHREKCIRLIYKGDFNIDLPVFYQSNQKENDYYLAMKSGAKPDDTSKMVEWFKTKIDKEGQLKRLIKYTKIWANCRTLKMPSGIMLTVWLANNYVPNRRDELALLATLKQVKNVINQGTKCKNPVNPQENLAEKLNNDQKKNFRIALTNLVEALEQSVQETNKNKALHTLKPFFGNRFLE